LICGVGISHGELLEGSKHNFACINSVHINFVLVELHVAYSCRLLELVTLNIADDLPL